VSRVTISPAAPAAIIAWTCWILVVFPDSAGP